MLVAPTSPELAVPRAAGDIGASLIVVSVGDDAWDATLASDIARRAGCSLLTVPAPAPVTADSPAPAPTGRWSPPMSVARAAMLALLGVAATLPAAQANDTLPPPNPPPA